MFIYRNDLSFNAYGYVLVLVNDLFTAASGLYSKKKLDSKELDSLGLVYYNSLCMLPALLLVCSFTDNFEKVHIE